MKIDKRNRIGVTNYIVKNKKIPEEFDLFKILQISDLHGREFGKNNSLLLKKIEECNPNIIVMTGDIIDRHKIHWDKYLKFLIQISERYPVYYVWGNHEIQSSNFREIRYELQRLPIKLLENETISVNKKNQFIEILGISDPYSVLKKNHRFYEKYIKNKFLKTLKKMVKRDDNHMFRILLSHRPEYFNIYGKLNIDLVFSGHAHGGQFRIPGKGGLIAPHQGFFPKYSEGCHRLKETTMVVSRGLGNSLIPFRIGNPPELVLVELRSYKK